MRTNTRSFGPVPSNSWLEIDLQRLRRNISVLKEASQPARMVGVVKANAYGHGSIIVAHELIDAGAHMLAVATIEEGIELRKAGIATPILVLGAPLPELLNIYYEYDLDLTISSLDVARDVAHLADSRHQKIACHIKIDTGMGRIGCQSDELSEVMSTLNKVESLEIRSIWTHLSQSTDMSGTFTGVQLSRFGQIQHSLTLPEHATSSYALVTAAGSTNLNSKETWTRIGVALYGMMDQRSFSNPLDLSPIMRWLSRLVQIKIVPEGTPISYGGRWVAAKPTIIGTVAAGYADGYKRELTGKASVGINGKRYPVVGTICMDMFMIDLGDPGGRGAFSVGDEVILMGEGGPSVFEMAEWANTISYEIATSITSRVGRYTVED